jgi:uncharacterized protein (TIGR02099 family)
MSMRKDNNIASDQVTTHPLSIIHPTLKMRCARLLKKCWMPLAIVLIIMAILFSLFRALTPWAKQYKGDVERHLSVLIGQPVIINSMETSWYWFEPVLRLNQVTVLDKQDHVLKFAKLLVGINVLSSLWHWHLQPGILYVDDVHLILRQVNDHWQIDGLRQDKKLTMLESEAYLPVLSWLLGQQKIIIKNVSALVHLNDGSLLPFSALNLTAINNNGHYRLKGQAKLAQTMATELLVLADMQLNPNALNKVSGHAYVSVHRFLPMQWQIFFPQAPYHLDGGKGDFEVWLDVLKGRFSGLQTRLNFHRIAWRKDGRPGTQSIQSLRANLAWSRTSDGWALSGDQIKLRANGVRWPENSFLVTHQQTQQTYSVFLQALLLEPLLATDIEWPVIMQPVLAVHPQGQLHNTQIETKNGNINYVLTRFSNVGWQEQGGFPAVSNISGVLNWQPSEGRLELDGEHTTIASKGLPPITFEQANAAFEWKELSHGLQMNIERLILSHSGLMLSARGAIDEPFSPDLRNLRLTAEFSADHAEQWLAYIPSQYVKPKLDDWLKHDIKRIDKASGQLTINGALANFPFDEQPGEFTVVSRLSGMDLLFHRKWPKIKDIDLNLHVDKRVIDLDVLHASLNGIEAEQANLHVDGLGLGQEALLLHGKIDVPASKLKAYVLATPLRSHLAKLKKLDITGTLGLDLNLEVPLYPESDDVFVRGVLALNNNEAVFHHALNDVQFNKLSGALRFDEHGVTESELKATLLGDPVAMHIQSAGLPKPHTEINIEGDTTVDILRNKFDLPIFSFMQGHLKFNSKLSLTNNPNDLDSMQISSPLEGVRIDLPAPLGKSSEALAPLTIDVDFNPEKALRLRLNYDDRINSDIWFAAKKGELTLDRGVVRVGDTQAISSKRSGLQLVGSLPVVDVQEWRDVWSQLPTTLSSSALIDKIQYVDMRLGDVAIWSKNYQKIAIKAEKLDKDAWSIHLDQRDVAGDVRYERLSNSLSGRFARLYLAKSALARQQGDSTPPLKPADIPNLNVTIDALKVDDVEMGKVALKSNSTSTNWHLESCNIKSPEYQLTIKGDWSRHEEINNTNLQANLQITSLAKSLELWHITPVIDAHQGGVEFRGGWSGAMNDFSLEKINGDVYLMFQNGRITNLSPDVETKLGLGKLLSILSLQTIPRRLKLDFSDLSNPGYSFDILKGNFSIKHGVLNTKDSYIDGPVAYASMKGDLDVIKHLYDVNVHISPHITASLPIVATIAGGPIAGMAAWVASKIINQGMQQVTGYTYKVSGPWLSPVVQQVSIYKKQT